MLTLFKKNKLRILFLSALLLLSFPLRFYQLSYSDYISDEPGTFFYRGGKKDPEMSKTEFILSQRKGPVQLFVGYVPYLIVGSYKNELAQRLPFAISGTLAVLAFYLFVEKATKKPVIALSSSFLLLVNGLVTAYGRIAQYQNLVMLFSFLALYFYFDLYEIENKKILRSTILGSIFFSLAFLSHWYAVFVFIPTAFFVLKFVKNKNIKASEKLRIFAINFFVICVLILPFLIPYVIYESKSIANIDYADKIFGWGASFLERRDLVQFKLYNPFLVLEFYLFCVVFQTGYTVINIFRKKPVPYIKVVFLSWLFIIVLFFRYFISYSGLHFYQIFFPILVLCGFTIYDLFYLFRSKVRYIFILPLAFLAFFFYYQTFLLFVENRVEYPWEQEKILWLVTPKHTDKDDLRHKTGFPHKRYWSQINDYINEKNKTAQVVRGYISNEDKALTKFYMDAPNDHTEEYFAIGVKRPYSFATDYKFSQIKNKKEVYSIENNFGETVVRIYLVSSK